VPAHPLAQALLEATALPVAAPSANPAGAISPTTADHVAKALGERIDLILDGGPCPIGLESTVVDLTGPAPRLLRPGGLVRSRIEAEIGRLQTGVAPGGEDEAALSPGQQASHYAPARPVRLDARTVAPDEALLAFGPQPLSGAAMALNLSPGGDLEEAAANLFAMLRALDQPGIRAIAIMPIPRHDLGEAIRDRLVRAAAPRPADSRRSRD
jgi:L-threonylcarbamoyladenylate synthase